MGLLSLSRSDQNVIVLVKELAMAWTHLVGAGFLLLAACAPPKVSGVAFSNPEQPTSDKLRSISTDWPMKDVAKALRPIKLQWMARRSVPLSTEGTSGG